MNDGMGIYCILCKATNRRYIGSSTGIKLRWRKHLSLLRKNTHYNCALQQAWSKYGEDKFSLEIVEFVEVRSDLHVREQYWMDEYKTYGKNGYNLSKTASFSSNPNPKCKDFIVTDPCGIEHTVNNLRKFCKNNNIDPNPMYRVAGCFVNEHLGWHCRYANMSLHEWIETRKKITPQIKRTRGTKFYTAISPDGHEFIIINMKQFCIKHNLGDHANSTMCKVAKGIYSQYKGWTCKYY